jgi:hypothetical protein
MTEGEQRRLLNHRLVVIRHAQEVTGNMSHSEVSTASKRSPAQ